MVFKVKRQFFPSSSRFHKKLEIYSFQMQKNGIISPISFDFLLILFNKKLSIDYHCRDHFKNNMRMHITQNNLLILSNFCRKNKKNANIQIASTKYYHFPIAKYWRQFTKQTVHASACTDKLFFN